MMRLPAITTMQQYFVLDGMINPGITINSNKSASPLNVLTSAIKHFPAHETYQVGKELGIREFRSFYFSFAPQDPLLLDMQWQSYLKFWWASAYLDQHAELDLNRIEEHNNHFTVTFVNSKITTIKEISKPNTPFLAGILAGFFSSLFDIEFEAIEPTFHEQGNQNCTFLLGSNTQVNATQFWRTLHSSN